MVFWQQVKLLIYLNLKINLALCHVQVGEGTFRGLLAAGDAAHLSRPEDILAHCYIQVNARLQYAINGKRNLIRLNAFTSLHLQHTLSYD